MPTYEYKCKECDHRLEVVQSFHDDPLTTCPNCRKKALRKVFSPPGVTFKGSGFYKTDSRSSSKASSASSSSSTDSSTSKDSSTSSNGSDSSKTSDSSSSSSSSSTEKASTKK